MKKRNGKTNTHTHTHDQIQYNYFAYFGSNEAHANENYIQLILPVPHYDFIVIDFIEVYRNSWYNF